MALVWVASAARVGLGFAAHEVFGAEGTLALACLVLLPWFLWNEARSGPLVMNGALFLTPKQDVVWLPAQATLERALEVLSPHRYSAVPILDARGGYVGTLTEGDILWHLLAAHEAGSRVALEEARVIDVPRHQPNRAVRIDAEIEALLVRAMHQNFVPVIDDRGAFIGIVRRQQIIACCASAAGIAADGSDPVTTLACARAPRVSNITERDWGTTQR